MSILCVFVAARQWHACLYTECSIITPFFTLARLWLQCQCVTMMTHSQTKEVIEMVSALNVPFIPVGPFTKLSAVLVALL